MCDIYNCLNFIISVEPDSQTKRSRAFGAVR